MMDKQTILITGATGNIGGGAAFALAKRGAFSRKDKLTTEDFKMLVIADFVSEN